MDARVAREIERMDQDWIKRAADRAARFAAKPEAYLARRAAIGWKRDVPLGAEPAEPDPSQLPGYKMHLSIDAITDAILELRGSRQQSRRNTEERDDIKAEYGPIFADVGLYLAKIPNWVRSERTIVNTRLA